LREAEEASRRLFEQVRELLKAFELFCGAGGLAEGMEQADAMESKFHLDHFEAAAKTFEKNILGSKAAVSEASTFLNRLFKKVVLGQDVADGDFLELLKDVEWVNAGPPCPGFSRMNHHRRSDDSRNALIGTFLSIVGLFASRTVFPGA
jgi:DNA (cytosine-5)-methyltransferase 1